MDNTENINVTINEDLTVDSNLEKEPFNPIPLEDIVLNLGFWLEMAQVHGKMIAQKKFDNAMSKSE